MSHDPGTNTRLRAGALLAAALLCTCPAAPASEREKTDAVTLHSGDRVTGEIVALEYGILQLKTSHMGTLRIEWPAIKSIDTRYTFHVERVGVQRLFGARSQRLLTARSSSYMIPAGTLTSR